MPDEYVSAFVDFLPNQPKTDETRGFFRKLLRERLEQRLSDSVERMWELPPMAVKVPPQKEGEPPQLGVYCELLVEARQLFVDGRFYACVAMCGIVGERLVKDLLRTAVLVEKAGETHRPSDAAFDQLEYVEVSGLTRFLKESGLLSGEAMKATLALGTLRNKYAHARGKNPPADAIEALKLLDALIADTVAVWKNLPQPEGGGSELQ
jgi:hypothetical protein